SSCRWERSCACGSISPLTCWLRLLPLRFLLPSDHAATAALEEEPLARESEQLGGLADATARGLEGVRDELLLEVAEGVGERLTKFDPDRRRLVGRDGHD